MNILVKYKIYNEVNGITLNKLILKVKYRMDNQFRYNKFETQIPDAVKEYCEINGIEITDELNALEDYFGSINKWNTTYKASFDAINKIGMTKIVEDLIVDDIKANHESDIVYSTYDNLIKSMVTNHGYKTFNFQVDKDKIKL